MDGLLDFVKGPLFRFSIAVLLLGLARIFILQLINGFEARRKAKEKKLPTKFVRKYMFGNLFMIRAFRTRPLYSLISIIFHVGIILTPLLLFDHILMIENEIGISWFALSFGKETADILTVTGIVAAVLLVIMRASAQVSRAISRKQDFLWPLILIVPLITGFVCANFATSPDAYNAFMLVHMLSGEMIFILIPFTKIAHCVLMPISSWITARAWKFPPDAGEHVLITLGKENEKI